MLGVTLIAILVLFFVFALLVARVEGLAFLAPKSTRGITVSAGEFCKNGCRLSDGRCPMTGTSEKALNCPLWKFVDADVPTSSYGSPFAGVQTP